MKKHLLNVLLFLATVGLYLLFETNDKFSAWSPPAKLATGLFLLTAYLWVTEVIPMHVTALLALVIELVVLFPMIEQSGHPVKKNIFLDPFFSDIILLFMGGFVISDLLNQYGISRKIIRFALSWKHVSPSGFVLIMMMVTAFFSMWISNTATTAMVLALIAPVLKSDLANANFKKLVPIAIAFSANLGGLGTPVGTPPNVIALQYLSQAGIHVSFLEWMAMMVPLVVVLLIILRIALNRLYPLGNISPEIFSEMKTHSGEKMSIKQIIVCVIFFLTAIGWMTSGLHPFSNGEVSLMMMVCVFGSGLLKIEHFNKLSWHILIILGGGLSLGVAIQESGMAANIVEFIPSGSGSGVLLGAIATITGPLSAFMNITAKANLFIPLFVQLKGFVLSSILVTVVMCSTNMLFPISTPPNVLAFEVGRLKFKDIFIPGVIISITSALLMPLFLYFSDFILKLF